MQDENKRAPQIDIFGETEKLDVLLREKYIEPPFSVLDTKGAYWKARKRQWYSIGMKSEVSREHVKTYNIPIGKYHNKEEYYSTDAQKLNTSIFDPVLCEVLYHWFCTPGGTIFDPFAGGSVRGIVANYLGYKYTGVDIRPEQIESNIEQALTILPAHKQPIWHCNDSDLFLNDYNIMHDFVFSCPPYADLEVYSSIKGDISNLPYQEFMILYDSIIAKSCRVLKPGGYACFVVGEVRNKKTGFYIGFISDTIKSFEKAGLGFYNEAILLNNVGSASSRAGRQMASGQKLVKIHQNILVFKKL